MFGQISPDRDLMMNGFSAATRAHRQTAPGSLGADFGFVECKERDRRFRMTSSYRRFWFN